MEINLLFDMPAHFVYANPKVHVDAGKVAVKKGPLVYCMEEMDNGKNLSTIFVDTKESPVESFEEGLLGGTVVLHLHGERIAEDEWVEDTLYGEVPVKRKDTVVTLIPYCYWGNRKTGEMQVWMKTCR